MSEAIMGLIGVVLGGVIAALTTCMFGLAADRDRKLALAYAAALKVHRISDIVYKVRKGVNEAWNAEGPEKWRYIVPILGVPTQHVLFTPEEVSLLLVGKLDMVANELITTANRYNLLIDIVHEYNAGRKDLGNEVRARANPEYSSIAKDIAFDPGALILLQPKIAEVESLANLMHEQANECFPFSTALANSIGATLKDLLKDDRFSLSMDFSESIKKTLASETNQPT